jgi:hypothetical protein
MRERRDAEKRIKDQKSEDLGEKQDWQRTPQNQEFKHN